MPSPVVSSMFSPAAATPPSAPSSRKALGLRHLGRRVRRAPEHLQRRRVREARSADGDDGAAEDGPARRRDVRDIVVVELVQHHRLAAGKVEGVERDGDGLDGGGGVEAGGVNSTVVVCCTPG